MIAHVHELFICMLIIYTHSSLYFQIKYDALRDGFLKGEPFELLEFQNPVHCLFQEPLHN